MPDFFNRGTNLKIIFSSWVAQFVTISAKQKRGLLMLMKKKYVKFLSKFFLMEFVFPSDKKGPRVTKISLRVACGLRAALWLCLK